MATDTRDPFESPDALMSAIARTAFAGIDAARRGDRVMRIRCFGCSHAPHAPGECPEVPRFTREETCGCGGER